jgi:glycosyltransferase involved in cell wall biosynthesis
MKWSGRKSHQIESAAKVEQPIGIIKLVFGLVEVPLSPVCALASGGCGRRRRTLITRRRLPDLTSAYCNFNAGTSADALVRVFPNALSQTAGTGATVEFCLPRMCLRHPKRSILCVSRLRDKIARFRRRPGEFMIGAVAPQRPEKNIDQLLRVSATLKNVRPFPLVLAGDGSERASIVNLDAAPGISDRVIFAGYAEAVFGAAHCCNVEDVKNIVHEENENSSAHAEEAAFAAAIALLLHGSEKRNVRGAMNRKRRSLAVLSGEDRLCHRGIFKAAREGKDPL